MADSGSTPLRPVVFITGASSGIGAAAVPLFAGAGYDVVLAARRKEKLEQVAAATRQQLANDTGSQQPTEAARGTQIVPVVCDVASDASVREAFAVVRERFGRLDVLINNAGFGVYGSVAETPVETYRANLETNFLGVVRCVQAALPLLRHAVQNPVDGAPRGRATIVMVSSFVGRRSLPAMSAYCASKFALEALSESLRVELHDEHIAVAVVNPGVTQTEFIQAAAGTRPANYIHPKKGMSADAVARVLLQAASRPCRNRYLTAAGKAGIVVQWLAPRLLDAVLVREWRKANAPTTKTP